ncbi:MAG: ATP-binding protein [Alphaproteobacteria bacterium]
MLKRFLPRSLFGRFMLIIGAPLVLVQMISIWVFYDRHIETITRRMALSVAGEIDTVLSHFETYKQPSDHKWIIDEAASNFEIRTEMHQGQSLIGRQHKGADTTVGTEMMRALDLGYKDHYIVDATSLPRHVKVWMETTDGVIEFTFPRKRLASVTTELVVAWSVGSTAVLLVVALLFMRNQVRPIRRLAFAADSFGKGRDVADFKPAGAKEVRQAATAFIIMRERLKRQLTQRTEMLAGVSHDLRTPITRMKLQLAMMPETQESKALNADLAEMESMVEEYLAFARGEGAERAVETNLPILLREVIDTAERNGQKIQLRTKGNLKVAVRPNGLKRVVNNLVANAARFGDRIEIQAQRKSGFVEITIDDNGPGVPESKRADVFKPFFRMENSRNRASGGAGLGLTIARDIMRGHGGDVLLADSPLGGLRAVLRLPV